MTLYKVVGNYSSSLKKVTEKSSETLSRSTKWHWARFNPICVTPPMLYTHSSVSDHKIYRLNYCRRRSITHLKEKEALLKHISTHGVINHRIVSKSQLKHLISLNKLRHIVTWTASKDLQEKKFFIALDHGSPKFFMGKVHTRYCGLPHGPHLEK